MLTANLRRSALSWPGKGRSNSLYRIFPSPAVSSHTRKSKTRGHARHGGRDKMIEVAIGGRGQFKRAETYVIESFIVDAICFICILNKLMNGERGIVRFDDRIRDFRRWNNRK